jgi:hypothetical protein
VRPESVQIASEWVDETQTAEMMFLQQHVSGSHLQNPLNMLSNNAQAGQAEKVGRSFRRSKMNRYLTIALGVAAAAGVHAALFAAVLA